MKESIICPRFEKAISLLSQRWTSLIINRLLSGAHRFCALETSIGISSKVLSDRLKHLEEQGIVKRDVIPETPVIIEYTLTEKGYALEPVLKEIKNWSQSWMELGSVEA